MARPPAANRGGVAALVLLVGPACHLPTGPAGEVWFEGRAASVRVRAREPEVAARVTGSLESIVCSHEEVFGARPRGLVVVVVTDPAHPGYEYDSFDHDTNQIWMHWPVDEAAYGEWTLAHELAHAHQYAFDPAAYRQEPSWIHEGWAEYGVWRFYHRRERREGDAFLAAQARRFLESGVGFEDVFRDVYAHDWRVAYPACHLAVHVLVTAHGGEERVARYFRAHGGERPGLGLKRVYGLRVTELAGEVEQLARRLHPPSPAGEESPE